MGQTVSTQFWAAQSLTALWGALFAACLTIVILKRALPKRIPFLPKAPVYTKGLRAVLLGDMADVFSPEFSHNFASSHLKTATECGWSVWQDRRALTSEIVIANPHDVKYMFLSANYNKMPRVPILAHVAGKAYLVAIDSPQRKAAERRQFMTAFSPMMIQRMVNTVVPRFALELVGEFKRQQPVAPDALDTVLTFGVRLMGNILFGPLSESESMMVAKASKVVSENLFFPLRIIGLNDVLFSANKALGSCRSEVFEWVQANQDRVVEAATLNGHPMSLVASYIRNPMFSTDPKRLTDLAVLLLLLAGEATSFLLLWALIDISRSPESQARLYQELCGAFDLGRGPELQTVRDCEYLSNCIKETLRLRHPSNLLQRWAVHDDVLPSTKTFVPAGTQIFVASAALNLNEAVHGPDAMEYRPERWERPDYAAECADSNVFATFGLGDWGCPGRELGREIVRMVLAILVRNVHIMWDPDQPPIAVTLGTLVRPAHSVKFRVESRLK